MNRKRKWGFFILTLCLSVLCVCMPVGRAHESAAAKQNKAGPKLTVSINEVSLEDARLEKDHHGVMKYFARVRNKSDSGTIRKIEYTFTITAQNEAGAVETGPVERAVGQKQVTLTVKNIKPGKVSGEVSCEGGCVRAAFRHETGEHPAVRRNRCICLRCREEKGEDPLGNKG